MTDNPFATEEAWDVSTGTILGPGDHVCEVLDIDGSTTSSGGHPQIEVRVGNSMGEIRDWIVVIPATIGKVTQFTDAVGLDRPADDQVRPEGTGFRLGAAYLEKAKGKSVGVIVRAEADRNDPSRSKDRVKGYVLSSKVTPTSDVPSNVPSNVPSDGPSFPAPSAGFPGAGGAWDRKNDDIPFYPSVI